MTPLFVELCAGLASVSGCLQHGSRWKPPVSRMGRKTGYAAAILRVMGLRPGGKAGAFLWAEADGDVAALLAAYTQPEKMREIAALIRSWIPCPYGPHEADPSCSRCRGTGRWDARDLWEVLRREKRAGLWEGGASVDSVARGALLGSWSYRQSDEDSGGFVGPGDRRQDTSALALDRAAMPWPPVLIAQDAAVSVADVARWAWVGRRSWKNDPAAGFVEDWPTGPLAEPDRQGVRYQADYPAPEIEASAREWPPTLLAQDAAVDVGSVAGWAALAVRSWKEDPVHGFRAANPVRPTEHHDGGANYQPDAPAPSFDASVRVWPPVHLTPDAAIPVPARLPAGTVCYIDPPYAGTTGYKADFSRDQVIETALRWHNAGARVYISEAVPIPIPGWFHIEIGGERVGQARTFGNTCEWLTCSVPPAWTPAVQAALFGPRP